MQTGGGGVVKHTVPLLSLANVFSRDELLAWLGLPADSRCHSLSELDGTRTDGLGDRSGRRKFQKISKRSIGAGEQWRSNWFRRWWFRRYINKIPKLILEKYGYNFKDTSGDLSGFVAGSFKGLVDFRNYFAGSMREKIKRHIFNHYL